MLASIFIGLLQTVAGAPAVAAAPPASEVAAQDAQNTPRTERRRVCQEPAAATGGRLAARRCRWEEVPVEQPEPETAGAAETPAASEEAATPAEAPRADQAAGVPTAAAPTPPSPQ